ARGWEQITDLAVIGKAVTEAFAADSKGVTAAAAGDEKIKAYLVGKTIAATGGRADPVIAGRLVTERLSSITEK
ncbi:MAG: Asp-tRNA(Asn)/Glu-tRNA(Gln) amidotransferase GatCAB subunit B, partial [Treponemataceae bacterium]